MKRIIKEKMFEYKDIYIHLTWYTNGNIGVFSSDANEKNIELTKTFNGYSYAEIKSKLKEQINKG